MACLDRLGEKLGLLGKCASIVRLKQPQHRRLSAVLLRGHEKAGVHHPSVKPVGTLDERLCV